MFIFMVLFLIIPTILLLLARQSIFIEKIFSLIAVISVFTFGSITMSAVYQILDNQTVFMTSIHAVFLEPFFLVSGGYLLFFFAYRLLDDLLRW